MDLYFFTEARFLRKDGVVYSHAGFSYDLWQRYLQRFDHVYVVGRLADTNELEGKMEANTSPDVTFIELPYYIGPFQFLSKKRSIVKRLREIIHLGDAYLCRVPGMIGSLAAAILTRKHIPYAVEIVGDPEESLSKTALGNNPLSFFYRNNSILRLKKVVRNSSAALYVTSYTLQKKYPVKEGIFTTAASNVILKDEHYAQKPHVRTKDDHIVKMLAAGTLAQLYKAPDVVIKALKMIKDKGYEFDFTWCGGGQYLEPMKEMAKKNGIGDMIHFIGHVNMQEVRNLMNSSDLFVHASRAEGLPRAVIEAMAMGLPCIGSKVAGIPELLSPEAIVNADDVVGLSEKMMLFIDNISLSNTHAKRNLEEAHKYHNDILTQSRLRFFDVIKSVSQ